MSKTLAQHVREHALSKRGGLEFFYIKPGDVHRVLCAHRCHGEQSESLTPTERRMFALFVACKLESEGVS